MTFSLIEAEKSINCFVDCGSNVSNFSLKFLAKTGAFPPVDIATTKSPLSTIDPKVHVHRSGWSTTLIKMLFLFAKLNNFLLICLLSVAAIINE